MSPLSAPTRPHFPALASLNTRVMWPFPYVHTKTTPLPLRPSVLQAYLAILEYKLSIYSAPTPSSWMGLREKSQADNLTLNLWLLTLIVFCFVFRCVQWLPQSIHFPISIDEYFITSLLLLLVILLSNFTSSPNQIHFLTLICSKILCLYNQTPIVSLTRTLVNCLPRIILIFTSL